MEQNLEMFTDERKNASAISSTSVTASPTKGGTLGSHQSGSPMKGFPWTPYGNPFVQFVARFALSRKPRLGRKYLFNMDAHNAVHIAGG